MRGRLTLVSDPSFAAELLAKHAGQNVRQAAMAPLIYLMNAAELEVPLVERVVERWKERTFVVHERGNAASAGTSLRVDRGSPAKQVPLQQAIAGTVPLLRVSDGGWQTVGAASNQNVGNLDQVTLFARQLIHRVIDGAGETISRTSAQQPSISLSNEHWNLDVEYKTVHERTTVRIMRRGAALVTDNVPIKPGMMPPPLGSLSLFMQPNKITVRERDKWSRAHNTVNMASRISTVEVPRLRGEQAAGAMLHPEHGGTMVQSDIPSTSVSRAVAAVTAHPPKRAMGLAITGLHSRNEAFAAGLNTQVLLMNGAGSLHALNADRKKGQAELMNRQLDTEGERRAAGWIVPHVLAASRETSGEVGMPRVSGGLGVSGASDASGSERAVGRQTPMTSPSISGLSTVWRRSDNGLLADASGVSEGAVLAIASRALTAQADANILLLRNGSTHVSPMEQRDGRKPAQAEAAAAMKARMSVEAIEARFLFLRIINPLQDGHLPIDNRSGSMRLIEEGSVSHRKMAHSVHRQQEIVSDAAVSIASSAVVRNGLINADHSTVTVLGRLNVRDHVDHPASLDRGQVKVLNQAMTAPRSDRVIQSVYGGGRNVEIGMNGMKAQQITLHLKPLVELRADGQVQLLAASLNRQPLGQRLLRASQPPVVRHTPDTAEPPAAHHMPDGTQPVAARYRTASMLQPAAMLPDLKPANAGEVASVLHKQPALELQHPAAEARQPDGGSANRQADKGLARTESGPQHVRPASVNGATGTDPFAQAVNAQRSDKSWTDADLKRLTDQVYRMLERKLKIARERRGL